MDQIVRRIRGEEIVFEIYTEQEAKDRNIPYKHWKDCVPGDYGLSDDGFVGVCLNKRTYTGRKKGKTAPVIFMAYGAAWVTGKGHINYLERKANNTYSRTSARGSDETEAARTRTKNAVLLAAEQLIRTGEVDYHKLGELFRPDQVDPAATMRRLFRSERVQIMLREEVRKALEVKGITEETVVERLDDVYDLAKKKKDLPNMLRSTENFVEILHMKQKPVRVTETLEIEGKRVEQIGDKVETEERKAKLSRTTDAPALTEGKGNGQTEEAEVTAGD